MRCGRIEYGTGRIGGNSVGTGLCSCRHRAGINLDKRKSSAKWISRSWAEVALLVFRRGHGSNIGAGQRALTELLKVKEEEGFVLAVIDMRDLDGPAQREAVIVAAKGILDVLGAPGADPAPHGSEV